MRISDWSSDVCSSDLTAQARRRRGLTARQAFILTTSSWILIPAVGALPLSFGGLDLSYTDAFFEAMSGITTTGATRSEERRVGTSVSVRVDHGGRRIIKKKKTDHKNKTHNESE